jgi:hypothetical protein
VAVWFLAGTDIEGLRAEVFMKDEGKGKVGQALERDAKQTKNDLTGGRKGQDLGQNAKDTVKQGTGREAIPPKNVPNTKK